MQAESFGTMCWPARERVGYLDLGSAEFGLGSDRSIELRVSHVRGVRWRAIAFLAEDVPKECELHV